MVSVAGFRRPVDWSAPEPKTLRDPDLEMSRAWNRNDSKALAHSLLAFGQAGWKGAAHYVILPHARSQVEGTVGQASVI